MTSVRLHSSFVRVGAVFKIPILSWTGEVPSRFFRAVYGALSEVLYIQPSDFVAPAGVSLGDCSATLRIFGGDSTLTLRANAVIADFPRIPPDRIQFYNGVIFQSYQALRTEFSELEIGSIEANAGHYLEITGDGKVEDVFTVVQNTALENRARNIQDVVVEPAMRCRLVSKDGKWNCKVTLEKSEMVTKGIFLHREIIVSDLSDCETTQQQLELVERIDQIILRLFSLEPETQSNGAN